MFERALEIARDDGIRDNTSAVSRLLISITNEIKDGHRRYQVALIKRRIARDRSRVGRGWVAFKKLLYIPVEPRIQILTGMDLRDIPIDPIPWIEEVERVRDRLIGSLAFVYDPSEWETKIIPAVAQLATEYSIRLRLI